MASSMDATENQPAKPVMEQFHEFMADIMEVQEKLTDGEYKKITESATKLYRACVEDCKVVQQTQSVFVDKAIEQMIRVIVRDNSWATLTAPRICELLQAMPGAHIPRSLDVKAVKRIMDREVRFLQADGRPDPAVNGKKRRRS